MTRDVYEYTHVSLRESEKIRLEEAELALFHMQMEVAGLRKQIAQLENALEDQRLRTRRLVKKYVKTEEDGILFAGDQETP